MNLGCILQRYFGHDHFISLPPLGDILVILLPILNIFSQFLWSLSLSFSFSSASPISRQLIGMLSHRSFSFDEVPSHPIPPRPFFFGIYITRINPATWVKPHMLSSFSLSRHFTLLLAYFHLYTTPLFLTHHSTFLSLPFPQHHRSHPFLPNQPIPIHPYIKPSPYLASISHSLFLLQL